MRFEERVKYAPILEYGGGHNGRHIIPEKKYFDAHPEYYPLREGKRLRPSETSGSTQLCFTHPELLKVFISEVDARIKANPDYDTYRIMIEDNYNLCECPNCLKPLTLADGTEVKADDPAFRSTQFFLWLNQIAAHVKKHYPGKLILTFGYFSLRFRRDARLSRTSAFRTVRFTRIRSTRLRILRTRPPTTVSLVGCR